MADNDNIRFANVKLSRHNATKTTYAYQEKKKNVSINLDTPSVPVYINMEMS